jgi:ATP-binding cassette, subfamily B, heavy metal transporter
MNNLQRKGQWATFKALLRYLWLKDHPELRIRLVIASICLVIAKLANIFVPILYKQAVDILSGNMDAIIAVPVFLIIGYGLVRLFVSFFSEIKDTLFAHSVQRAIRIVGLKVFRHLHVLSLRFHLQRRTGVLSRTIERGVKGIENLLFFSTFNLIPTILEIIFVCILLAYLYDIEFSLIIFVTLLSYILYTVFVTEWRNKYRRIMNKEENEASGKAVDSLLNFETVKYFTNEDLESNRFDAALGRYEKAAISSQNSLALLNLGQGIIISIGLVAVLYLAARNVANGTMSVGDFVLVNTYLIQLYMPLSWFGTVYRTIKQSLIDLEDMIGLLDVPVDVLDKENSNELRIDKGHIKFKAISFSYDVRRPIFKDVSFEVPQCSTVAVVGPSGAGKSSLVRLLYRFYDVENGAIEIDDQNIKDVTQNSLRRAIGIVPQDTVLFNDTLYYNIAYGRMSATKEEVEEAARLAQIHDFIETLPDGYRTFVGERGLKLSGGEKQRVAIARVILKNPAIYVFDEATSALDSKTEKDIQQSLWQISRGASTLIIAHRLSTIIDADQIIVLEKGAIVERGTHQELLATQGVYAMMWQRQQETARLQEELQEIKQLDGIRD